jgi:hypothetical protein
MPFRHSLSTRGLTGNTTLKTGGLVKFAFLSHPWRCGTGTVQAPSLCLTSDSYIHRMFFRMNSSLSIHGRPVFEETEDESLYRR